MTIYSQVVLVDIIKDAVEKTAAYTGLTINYEPGRWYQILQELSDLDNSTTMKGLKFPLFAMQMPIQEKRGVNIAGYSVVTIPRIVIAVLTKSGDGSERVLDKFASNGVFKTILYPIYSSFIDQIARSGYTLPNDPDAIVHRKMDNPGQQVTESTNDFIDSIEILDLEITLIQTKTC